MLSIVAVVLSLVALVLSTWALHVCLHFAQISAKDRR